MCYYLLWFYKSGINNMKNKINIVLVVLLTVMTSVTIILALYAYVQKSNIDDLKQDLNNIKRNS
jgi:FtsH-binding integral membrane protein